MISHLEKRLKFVLLALFMFSSASFWYLSLTYLYKPFEIQARNLFDWWVFSQYSMRTIINFKKKFQTKILSKVNWPDGYKHTLGRSNQRHHKHWKMNDSRCRGWNGNDKIPSLQICGIRLILMWLWCVRIVDIYWFTNYGWKWLKVERVEWMDMDKSWWTCLKVDEIAES